MADIFISYSKADRLLVEQLSAYLEAEGWSVWWDRSLSGGDTYRDEIMKELARARAVIAVWSASSVKSDWVRAEAGRAKADGKLIPVKAHDVSYSDIPLPFGEMHTEALEARQLLRAAIVGMLARPQVEASGLRAATAGLRYAALTWFGIVGAAVTLLSNMKGVITLADWTAWIAEHAVRWSHLFWQTILGWTGLTLPPHWAGFLSFLAFAATTLLGSRLALGSPRGHKYEEAEPNLMWKRPWLGILVNVLGPPAVVLLAAVIHAVFYFAVLPERAQPDEQIMVWFILLTSYLLMAAVLVPFSRDRPGLMLFGALWLPIGLVFSNLAGPEPSNVDFLFAFLVYFMFPFALSILPARVLNLRFSFILIGLALLIGLSEISKLNLGQFFAPKT